VCDRPLDGVYVGHVDGIGGVCDDCGMSIRDEFTVEDSDPVGDEELELEDESPTEVKFMVLCSGIGAVVLSYVTGIGVGGLLGVLGVAFIALIAGWGAREQDLRSVYSEDAEFEDEESLREAFLNGEIGEDEFERRLEERLDDDPAGEQEREMATEMVGDRR
jgi:uncharacterized membrane protein